MTNKKYIFINFFDSTFRGHSPKCTAQLTPRGLNHKELRSVLYLIFKNFTDIISLSYHIVTKLTVKYQITNVNCQIPLLILI